MDALTSNIFDCALVFEGGGYRVGYSAGITSVLVEQGIFFDYVCGVSAGAGNSVNYVARDQRRIKGAFMTDGPARNAVGLRSLIRGKGYFDADLLYEGALTKGLLPFDWESFCANPARVRIQAFDRDTGKSVRFGKDDMTDAVRMVNLVRASSTLPGFMTPLPMDGRTLYDGGLGAGAGIPVCLAEDDGFDRVFFVATRPRGYRKSEPTKQEHGMYARVAKDYPYLRNALLTRWERYNEALDHVEAMAEEGRAFIVYPEDLGLESTTVNPHKLSAAFEAGRARAQRDLPLWREFLFGTRDGGPEATDQGTGYITIG